jgi:superfamily II DNA helicase RecQ
MAYRFFRMACDADETTSDIMNAFLRGRSVVRIEKRWIEAGDHSFWAFCVQYQETRVVSTESTAGKGAGSMVNRIDYREVLDAAQFQTFSVLRDRRKALAEKDGAPLFAVMSNEHLAEIVKRKITTVAELSSIPGLGVARIGKYGAEMLSGLTAAPPATVAAPAEETAPAPPITHEDGELPF